jgi:tetratricopeptide (TPR) repeat protein
MKRITFLIVFVCLGVQPFRSETDDTVLAALEAQLEAHPNDLKAGSDYRQAVIQKGQYDRALRFFEGLITRHSKAPNARLNYGFAFVDKIPAAGAITQVILANQALTQFSEALKLEPSWIGFYTRGNSYLYWPVIFNRANLGIVDLEQALKIQRTGKKQSYHVRVYTTLGDGYWKVNQPDKAMAIWKEGLSQFPDDSGLKIRLSRSGPDLQAIIDAAFDFTKRVNTDLEELWRNE